MIQNEQKQGGGYFNEYEWLKVLFMLGDVQTWLSEMEKELFMKQPSGKKRKLFQKTYYLTASSFAHIIERHYYKIPRHIGAAKFTIGIPDILEWLRAAFQQKPVPIRGSLNFAREFNTGADIGFDKSGIPSSILSVITDAGGRIITAFPGRCDQALLSPDDPVIPEPCSQLQEEEAIYIGRMPLYQ